MYAHKNIRTSYIPENVELLRAQVGDDTDVIGVVPRGVGATFPPITCDATDAATALRNTAVGNSPPGYANTSLSESYQIGKGLAIDCGNVAPKLFPVIGSVFTASDMDYVRQALGEDKLNFL